jgi:hypothetical protein
MDHSKTCRTNQNHPKTGWVFKWSLVLDHFPGKSYPIQKLDTGGRVALLVSVLVVCTKGLRYRIAADSHIPPFRVSYLI